MRIKKKINEKIWRIRARFNRLLYPQLIGKKSGITVLSQNCIGGVVMRFLNMTFCSPTVNVFFPMNDFVKLCENIEKYISVNVTEDEDMTKEAGYPVCHIDDITVHCVHYQSADDFIYAWNKRKQRMTDNFYLIMTDRDGFTEDLLPRIDRLPYPKVLFSKNNYGSYGFVVKVDYGNDKMQVGDLTRYYGIFGKRVFEKYYDFAATFKRIANSSCSKTE